MKDLPQNEAILFIPGLNNPKVDHTLEGFAYRLKKAIDINHENEKCQFALETRSVKYGPNNSNESKVISIFKTAPGKKELVYDIYEYQYSADFVARFENMNILGKAIMLFIAMVSKFPSIIFHFRKERTGLSTSDKMQSLYVGFIFFCLSAYGVILVSALVSAVSGKIHFISLPDLPEDLFNGINFSSEIRFTLPSGKFFEILYNVIHYLGLVFHFLWYLISNILQYIANFIFGFIKLINIYKTYILSSSAVFLLLMPDLKNSVTAFATHYLCLINYFNIGENRLNMIGKIEELTEHISECDYHKIHLYSISFGSLLALDALFPHKSKPAFRLRTKINTLVTVGCPFDFVRTYWPSYYEGRIADLPGLKNWYNIHSETDILSSNFRNDSKDGEAKIAIAGNIVPKNISFNLINPENISFFDRLLFIGIRTNSMYWDHKLHSASCLTSLLQHIDNDSSENEVYVNYCEIDGPINEISIITDATIKFIEEENIFKVIDEIRTDKGNYLVFSLDKDSPPIISNQITSKVLHLKNAAQMTGTTSYQAVKLMKTIMEVENTEVRIWNTILTNKNSQLRVESIG